MQTVKQPYEFLVRWDQDGNLAGAHVRWRYVTTDDGEAVTESESGAEPVAVTEGANGFPLADILSTVQADALAAAATLTAQIATVTAERDALAVELAQLRGA